MLRAGQFPDAVTGPRAVLVCKSFAQAFGEADYASQHFELSHYGSIHTKINNLATAAFQQSMASLGLVTEAVAEASAGSPAQSARLVRRFASDGPGSRSGFAPAAVSLRHTWHSVRCTKLPRSGAH